MRRTYLQGLQTCLQQELARGHQTVPQQLALALQRVHQEPELLRQSLQMLGQGPLRMLMEQVLRQNPSEQGPLRMLVRHQSRLLELAIQKVQVQLQKLVLELLQKREQLVLQINLLQLVPVPQRRLVHRNHLQQ